MTEKEIRILFLRTKLENESKELNSDDFFKLIKDNIGWTQYSELYSEYARNSVLDHQTHTKLTNLGVNTLKKLEYEYKQEVKDQLAERKKLHNDSIISEWKRKTFWFVFIFGLFGGIYSSIDLVNKLFIEKEKEQIQKTKIEVTDKPIKSKIDSLKLD